MTSSQVSRLPTNCEAAILKRSKSFMSLRIIVAVRLLVQIAEEVERFDRHVGSADTALQKRPEVLKAVGVDVSVHVLQRRDLRP